MKAKEGKALEGRIALTTGATRGLGEKIAHGLAREGALSLVGCRRLAEGERVAKAIVAAGGRAEAIVIDVADPASIRAAAKLVDERHGRLDVLQNNAGVLLDHGTSTEALTVEVLEETFRVNVRGPLLCTQAFLPLLRRSKHGRIVNMSSGLGCLAEGMSGGYPAYRMSKTALNAQTRNLAAELEGTGILVHVVSPGWCRTDMGGEGAPLSAEEGADTAIFVACLPDDGPTGLLYEERAPRDW